MAGLNAPVLRISFQKIRNFLDIQTFIPQFPNLNVCHSAPSGLACLKALLFASLEGLHLVIGWYELV